MGVLIFLIVLGITITIWQRIIIKDNKKKKYLPLTDVKDAPDAFYYAMVTHKYEPDENKYYSWPDGAPGWLEISSQAYLNSYNLSQKQFN